MSAGISVNVVLDQGGPALDDLKAKLNPERLAKSVGPACAKVTRGWLRSLPSNKRGWPTTNFWQRAARSTSWSVVDGGALVSVNQIGVRQRYHGGPISPVKKRALTIPISPKAYGKTASDFPDAFLLKTKKGAFIVQHGEQVSEKSGKVKSRKGRGFAAKRVTAFLEFLFKLSGGVFQKPDPGVLPAEDVYVVTAHQAIREAIA